MPSELENPLPKTGAASLQPQWVRCGKLICRCASGDRHGPYWYVFWRAGGRLRKRYVPRTEVDTLRVLLSERRSAVAERRATEHASMTAWREQRHELREVEQWLTPSR